MLIEEVQTRKRVGIQHLKDSVLRKLMLSIGKYAEGKKMGTSYSYDLLVNKYTAESLSYVHCS